MNHRNFRETLNHYSWDGNKEDKGFDDDFPAIKLPDSFPDLSIGYSKQPLFTHYSKGFKANLDHILMSSNAAMGKLRPFRQAPMPTLEDVTCHEAMPSPNFPSDHVSIACDIEWISQTHSN